MKPLKNAFLFFLLLFVIFSLFCGTFVLAQENYRDKEKENRLAETMGFDPKIYAMLNINNLTMWERRDGKSNHSPKEEDGTYFPRGTSHVIYQDGFVWGAKAYIDAGHTQPAPFDQLIRVGGATYGTGSRAGWVIGEGANAVPVDQDNPRVRIYRIRRDWKEKLKDWNGDWTYIVRQEAADCFEKPSSDVTEEEMRQIYDDYTWCWENWPVDLGAPYIDRNGNGVYDPPPGGATVRELIEGNYDEPGIAGADLNHPADQVIWAVWNDLNRSLRFGSEPTGLEVQSTVWGYNLWGSPLGNVFFRRIRFTNKGGVEIDTSGSKGVFYLDSMYVSQWSDPDIGDAGDDLAGCDPGLNLGFAYNSNATDNLFREFHLPPPAIGYDILQGPVLFSPGDRAVFDLKYKQDFKNMGITSFSHYISFSGQEPPVGYVNSIYFYKLMRGYAHVLSRNQYFPHPPNVTPGPFPFSGDPLLRTGFIDGLGNDWSPLPGDRRILCNTGPFQLAPGETQEVVLALVCGLGADNLSSISVMKYNDRFAQSAYDALFSVPQPPKPPHVNVSEMDGKVILEWGSDRQRVAEIEKAESPVGGLKFEGYTVYQLPSANAAKKEATRIATFDLPTGPTVVLDEVFDQASGQYLRIPVQFGSNSGIRREFVFDRDYLRGIDKINNGSEYYLAVTAYSVASAPNFIPKTLESPLQIITVVPQSRGLGEVIGSDYGQVVDAVIHTQGSGSAIITPVVIEPNTIIPATYTISWDADSTWKITKEGTNLVSGQTNYSGDEDYPIVDGIKVKVSDVHFAAPLDFSDYRVDPADHAANYKIDSYYSNGWAADATSLTVRGFGTKDISLLQNDIELRFTGEYADDGVTIKEGTGSMATFIGAHNYSIAEHPLNPNPGSDEPFPIRIPFEVWDVERDMQINILIYDRIQTADSVPFYAFNPAGRMYCYLNSLPYRETALDTIDERQNTWNLVFRKTDWQTGDVISVKYADPIIPGVDEFTYSTAGLETTVNNNLKKKDVRRIGVFPNPYYAFNPLETHQADKFVTFNNLPPKATVRIFNLAGHLVKVIEKNDNSKFLRWDLRNQSNYYVASGVYIAYINMPVEDLTRILKLVIIMETEFLPVY